MKTNPVITVDGPSGSGKGTLSQLLAKKLQWHLLDSGALYRVLALAAEKHAIAWDNYDALEALAEHLDVRFEENEGKPIKIILEGEEVTSEIRTESCGMKASIVASIPGVRQALLARQRTFRQAPGLIADGRDMGTVVFPDADFKVFLEASHEIRAKRRWAELQQRGLDVSLESLLEEIKVRDVRDRQRAISPLVPAEDAYILDTSQLGIHEVYDQVMQKLEKEGILAYL